MNRAECYRKPRGCLWPGYRHEDLSRGWLELNQRPIRCHLIPRLLYLAELHPLYLRSNPGITPGRLLSPPRRARTYISVHPRGTRPRTSPLCYTTKTDCDARVTRALRSPGDRMLELPPHASVVAPQAGLEPATLRRGGRSNYRLPFGWTSSGACFLHNRALNCSTGVCASI